MSSLDVYDNIQTYLQSLVFAVLLRFTVYYCLYHPQYSYNVVAHLQTIHSSRSACPCGSHLLLVLDSLKELADRGVQPCQEFTNDMPHRVGWCQTGVAHAQLTLTCFNTSFNHLESIQSGQLALIQVFSELWWLATHIGTRIAKRVWIYLTVPVNLQIAWNWTSSIRNRWLRPTEKRQKNQLPTSRLTWLNRAEADSGHMAMAKGWLWASAALSAALALQGTLRGQLGRAAAAAGLTAVLLAAAGSRRPTQQRLGRPARYPKQYVARTALSRVEGCLAAGLRCLHTFVTQKNLEELLKFIYRKFLQDLQATVGTILRQVCSTILQEGHSASNRRRLDQGANKSHYWQINNLSCNWNKLNLLVSLCFFSFL